MLPTQSPRDRVHAKIESWRQAGYLLDEQAEDFLAIYDAADANVRTRLDGLTRTVGAAGAAGVRSFLAEATAPPPPAAAPSTLFPPGSVSRGLVAVGRQALVSPELQRLEAQLVGLARMALPRTEQLVTRLLVLATAAMVVLASAVLAFLAPGLRYLAIVLLSVVLLLFAWALGNEVLVWRRTMRRWNEELGRLASLTPEQRHEVLLGRRPPP